ncbi:hypothetical protein IWW40_004448 [Coemansia sp. RSA 1250]|nr:hypothetical protein IWW40_004448 [Coemansia sp. RSA 1250]
MSSIKGFLESSAANPDEVLQYIKDNKYVVVDFTATWCGPCKLMKPKFAQFSETYKNIQFVMVDVDEFSPIAAHYGVSAMPTFKLIKDGKVVDEIVGANAAALEQKLKKFDEEAKSAKEEAPKEAEAAKEEAPKETEAAKEEAPKEAEAEN